MGRLRVTPRAYERITLAALVALVVIVVTGAAVRLTGSGLGCPDWPACTEDRLLAPLEYHAMVEFVNRVVTGAVSGAVALAVLGALVRVPRRRDLVWLSWGLVAGVGAQILLGAATVLLHLAPPIVMGHFLLSMVLVGNATVLHHRATLPDGVPSTPAATTGIIALSRWLIAAASLVLVTGTVVTASGPHGGDEAAERLDFFVPDVARVHGGSVIVFLTLVVVTLALARQRAGAAARRHGSVLLAVLLAQVGVGYVQYFTGVPVVLVAVHVLGAVAVWTATLRFHLALAGTPAPAEAPAERGEGARVVTSVAGT